MWVLGVALLANAPERVPDKKKSRRDEVWDFCLSLSLGETCAWVYLCVCVCVCVRGHTCAVTYT